MLAACDTLFDRWGLSDEQSRSLLGSPAHRDLQDWRDGAVGEMPYDVTRRLGHLLAIHNALRLMFSDPARAYAWVRCPNDVFCGRAALDLMLTEPEAGVERVRSYLDAESHA